MARTYVEHSPATIWEAYAPDLAAPSTGKDDQESLNVIDDGKGRLTVETAGPLTLTVDGTSFDLPEGRHTLHIPRA